MLATLLVLLTALSDTTFSSTRDTLLTGDSVVVVHTVCAPQCSSVVQVFSTDGTFRGRIMPPFASPFPVAKIEEGKIVWEDHQPQDE